MWVLSSQSRVRRVRKKKSSKKKFDLVTCGLHMLELEFSFCDEKIVSKQIVEIGRASCRKEC